MNFKWLLGQNIAEKYSCNLRVIFSNFLETYISMILDS